MPVDYFFNFETLIKLYKGLMSISFISMYNINKMSIILPLAIEMNPFKIKSLMR